MSIVETNLLDGCIAEKQELWPDILASLLGVTFFYLISSQGALDEKSSPQGVLKAKV